ncbi:hypothetical protein HBA55_21350 [Pseudomaricurvus alkylphenolicus]|uniref:FecR family protein n=1 Tax=Pseudomaricurvus alkylphenolicus TaxID=1306991 RepID=UPI00141E7215|nr:FecR domain-containing protein [Pseudomaricurvus alkylphenolicus]NIB42167.1 hypothetical protein [Pseudomaricurvus alkylphenolicus]
MTNHSGQHSGRLPTNALEDAAKWFSVIQERDISLHERKRFDNWINESKINEEAFAAVSSAWLGPQGVDQDAYIKNACSQAMRSHVQSPQTLPQRLWTGPWAMAATVMLVVAVGLLMNFMEQSSPYPIIYETSVGKQKNIGLEDGSILILDTNSRVAVNFRDTVRQLTLEQGQAYFQVAHDNTRPFVVRAGTGEVTALGTAFDIRLDGPAATVKLIEGRVKVNLAQAPDGPEMQLVAGQQIRVESDQLSDVKKVDLVNLEAWKMGKIIFSDTPLPDAINEMNRYRKKKYELRGAKAAEVRVSGIFNIDNADKFTSSLVSYFPIQARESSQSTIILQYREK